MNKAVSILLAALLMTVFGTVAPAQEVTVTPSTQPVYWDEQPPAPTVTVKSVPSPVTVIDGGWTPANVVAIVIALVPLLLYAHDRVEKRRAATKVAVLEKEIELARIERGQQAARIDKVMLDSVPSPQP